MIWDLSLDCYPVLFIHLLTFPHMEHWEIVTYLTQLITS